MATEKKANGGKKTVVIEVLHPGALPGKTKGDVIEKPTPEQIAIAKKNSSILRIREK
jgi:hypothetical protein